jgi:pyridinium-3,5-biscarboxylic acid mononucleotide synthase
VDIKKIKKLLSDVKTGKLKVEEAYSMLKHMPYDDIGHAKLDNHRAMRKGFPEVIYCEGKTTQQIVEIAKKLSSRHDNVMATRASKEVYRAVKMALKRAKYDEMARIITIGSGEKGLGKILIISAGTADMKVAEEAAVTAKFLGNNVERLYDVGVAGIHRLLSNTNKFEEANAIIVAAGMEGALASVVGGIAEVPVIAVPTSIGYGASFKGLAALLSMLNSCAPGVAVVNIDNGFGAGVMASIINRNRT